MANDPIGFRLSDTAMRLIQSLCAKLGLKRSAVVELAVRDFAKKHDVGE